jgi:hypothetical protein
MIEADKGSSTSGDGREPITLPEWLPPAVAKQVRRTEVRDMPTEQRAILLRLTTDTRMRGVWSELTRRKRPGGGFLHPAKRPPHKPALTQEEAQAEALGYLFHLAFRAACDEIPVSKPDEIAAEKAKLIQKACMLREIADDLAVTNPVNLLADADVLRRSLLAAADVDALHRVA